MTLRRKEVPFLSNSLPCSHRKSTFQPVTLKIIMVHYFPHPIRMSNVNGSASVFVACRSFTRCHYVFSLPFFSPKISRHLKCFSEHYSQFNLSSTVSDQTYWSTSISSIGLRPVLHQVNSKMHYNISYQQMRMKYIFSTIQIIWHNFETLK